MDFCTSRTLLTVVQVNEVTVAKGSRKDEFASPGNGSDIQAAEREGVPLAW